MGLEDAPSTISWGRIGLEAPDLTIPPHLIEEFALETGLASFNKLTIVPLITFNEGVIPRVKKVHGL